MRGNESRKNERREVIFFYYRSNATGSAKDDGDNRRRGLMHTWVVWDYPGVNPVAYPLKLLWRFLKARQVQASALESHPIVSTTNPPIYCCVDEKACFLVLDNEVLGSIVSNTGVSAFQLQYPRIIYHAQCYTDMDTLPDRCRSDMPINQLVTHNCSLGIELQLILCSSHPFLVIQVQ